jgi:hypothetical protein
MATPSLVASSYLPFAKSQERCSGRGTKYETTEEPNNSFTEWGTYGIPTRTSMDKHGPALCQNAPQSLSQSIRGIRLCQSARLGDGGSYKRDARQGRCSEEAHIFLFQDIHSRQVILKREKRKKAQAEYLVGDSSLVLWVASGVLDGDRRRVYPALGPRLESHCELNRLGVPHCLRLGPSHLFKNTNTVRYCNIVCYCGWISRFPWFLARRIRAELRWRLGRTLPGFSHLIKNSKHTS